MRLGGRTTLAVRAALAVYVTCFTIGALSHARDFLTAGWLPYRSGLVPLDVFWTSLVGLDAAVVGLLLSGRRRSGLLLALAVMVLDVSANSYAAFAARLPFETDRLVQQAIVLGFVFGSVAFLWPDAGSGYGRRR